MSIVNLPPKVVQKYLEIAYAQRKRAAKKFEDDYGTGAALDLITQELKDLQIAINTIKEK